MQTSKDLWSGTVAVETVAAAAAIVEGGRLKRDGPYCAEEADCFTDVTAPRHGAITVGHTIRFDDKQPGDPLIAHEMQHVYDIENVDAVAFYASYGAEYGLLRRVGLSHDAAYRNIFWEQRGYAVQNGYEQGVRPRGFP